MGTEEYSIHYIVNDIYRDVSVTTIYYVLTLKGDGIVSHGTGTRILKEL